jgi:hypothetical protein
LNVSKGKKRNIWVTEGLVNGVMEGAVNGATEGLVNGVMEGAVNRVIEGVANGVIEGAVDVARSQGGFENPFSTVVAGGSAHFLAEQGGFENNKMPCHSSVHNQFPTVVARGSAHFLGKLKTDAQIERKKRKKQEIHG